MKQVEILYRNRVIGMKMKSIIIPTGYMIWHICLYSLETPEYNESLWMNIYGRLRMDQPAF